MKHSFEPGHKKHGGRPKGKPNKQTVWVLEELKKKGVDYSAKLVEAINARDFDMLDRLIKLAPHIANRPTEHVGMEGIDGLVVKEYKEEKKPDEKK